MIPLVPLVVNVTPLLLLSLLLAGPYDILKPMRRSLLCPNCVIYEGRRIAGI